MSEGPSVPIDAARTPMNEYVAVFPKPEPPPGEYRFSAIGDDHAAGLMIRQYPGHKWTLYRLEEGKRRRICDAPDRAQRRRKRGPENYG